MHFSLFTLGRAAEKQPRSCSSKKGILEKLAKLTAKHLSQSFFFNQAAGPEPCNFFKKKLRNRCFLVNFAKFLRTPILSNSWERLLLFEGWRTT